MVVKVIFAISRGSSKEDHLIRLISASANSAHPASRLVWAHPIKRYDRQFPSSSVPVRKDLVLVRGIHFAFFALVPQAIRRALRAVELAKINFLTRKA
jgi:hypothetical protein